MRRISKGAAPLNIFRFIAIRGSKLLIRPADEGIGVSYCFTFKVH
jgi:hypothetical protein